MHWFGVAAAALVVGADAQGLNLDKVFAERPKYATKTASTTTTNRATVASSVIQAMNARKGSPTSIAGHNPKSTRAATVSTRSAPSTSPSKATTTSRRLVTSVKPVILPTTKASSTRKALTTTKAKASSTPKRKRHVRRQAANSCNAEVINYGYTPNPNTPLGFLTDTSLINTAASALAPAGYTTTFNGQVGSLFADNYLGFYQLSSYNVAQCTALCEANSACKAINLYFERDPTLNPGNNCRNPAAAVSVRCALWGSTVSQAQAQNIGQWRTDFMVVISGSNGYTKNTPPPAISSFTGPTALAGAISVTTINSQTVFISDSFTNGAYNPALCTAACSSLNTRNRASAIAASQSSYTSCNYINAYQVNQNGSALGTYCQLFTTSAVASGYDTLYTATRNGVVYDITYSYGYALSVSDSGLVGTGSTSGTTSATSAGATTASTTTTTSAARTTTTTTTTRTTTTTASPSPTNEFAILSAYFADSDVTTQARANFLSTTGTTLSIDTTFPSTALATDPWSGNPKTLVILYTWRNETRVFAAIANTGSYVQQAAYYTASTAPGSTLVTTNTASTTGKFLAAVWGNQQYTSASVYSGLDSYYTSNSSYSPSNGFFGSDPMQGIVKDAVIWYYGASTTLKTLAVREYTSAQFQR